MTQDLPTQSELNEIFKYRNGYLYWDKKVSDKVIVGKRAGSQRENGYIRIKLYGKYYYAHRIIYQMHYGMISSAMEIDHIDRNKFNNSIENLRQVTSHENSCNTQHGKGYIKNKRSGNYAVRVQVKGKQKHIGTYKTEEEAHKAYLEAREKHLIIEERT